MCVSHRTVKIAGYLIKVWDRLRFKTVSGYSDLFSLSLLLTLDVNECTTNSHTCDVNAVCWNTLGSHTCLCRPGYTGNGKTCSGENDCKEILGIEN